MKIPKGKYISTVSLGEKGQIVIPKKMRDMFGIQPGDTLLLLADVKRGIAITKYDAMGGLFERALADQREADAEEGDGDAGD
ncbi:MAG: AbrB/MazE/SpoVT family DNA-binding domain-containing protein [Butyricicoccus sp.]|nr:AbrB/MazE/SpoVT family DNA-binding domain-containing protein [Butyricicoccus sp.]